MTRTVPTLCQHVPSPADNFTRGLTTSRPAALAPDRIWHEPPLLPPFRPPSGTIGFSEIARAAGIIFCGTVISISPVPASGMEAPQVVALTFRVEHAFRGSSTGRNLTVFQWTGAWNSGQRYRVGERVLLFLYPPSKLGLTSSVGGSLGRFALDPLGRALLTDEHLAAFGADPVLRGKSRVSMRDFAQAVRRAREEE